MADHHGRLVDQRRVSAILTLALLAACGTEGPAPSPSPANTVSLNTASASLTAIGDTVRLVATARDGMGNEVIGPSIIWYSNNASVAVVSDLGTVIATGTGTTKVVVQWDDASDSASIQVLQAPDSISLGSTPAWMFVGDTLRLAATVFDANANVIAGAPVSWSSSDIAIATIDGGGLATTRATGTARFIANAGNGVTAEAALVSEAAPVHLGAAGFDLELDTLRNLAYVSLPTRNEVAVISTDSGKILRRVVVGSRPRGIDISLDGSKLYVALNGAGAIAVVDLTSYAVGEIVIGDSLGSSSAWDVVEARPNRLFASANPGSSGFAWIVQVATDAGNAHWRVAGYSIIRADPELVKSVDGTTLYVGEGFSPNSLYRLNLLDPLAPIVLEDQHGAVSGTDRMSLSRDGTRIYLRSGQVLRTESFIQAGVVSSGIPAVSADGQRLFVAGCRTTDYTCADNIVEVFSTQTFLPVDTLPFHGQAPSRLRLSRDERVLWVLSDDQLHLVDIPGGP